MARASQLYQQLSQLGVFPVSGVEATGEVSGSACVAGGGPPVLIYCRVLAHGAVVVQAKSPNPQAAAAMRDMLQVSIGALVCVQSAKSCNQSIVLLTCGVACTVPVGARCGGGEVAIEIKLQAQTGAIRTAARAHVLRGFVCSNKLICT